MSVVRAANVRLLGLRDDKGGRAKVAIVRLVVDDGPLPRVLMHEGDPFILESMQGSEGLPLYARERAVRIDQGMIVEVAR